MAHRLGSFNHVNRSVSVPRHSHPTSLPSHDHLDAIEDPDSVMDTYEFFDKHVCSDPCPYRVGE